MATDLTKYLNDLEDVPCDTCSLKDSVTLARSDKYGLPLRTVACKRCGLMYINPRPSKKMYIELNKADYRLAAIGTDSGLESIFKKQYDHANHTMIPLVKPHLNKEPKNLLDIGCCNGGTIAAWQEHYPNLHALGIEPVIKVAKDAARRTTCVVHQTIFEDFASSLEFDLIIFAQALNHTLTPLANLKKVSSLLSNHGLLFLSLYDAASVLCTRPPHHMAEIMHPYMFSHESIAQMLSQAGLSVQVIRGQPLDGASLKKWHIPFILSPRIQIVATNATADTATDKFQFNEFYQRLQHNMHFYDQHKNLIAKWKKPSFWHQSITKAGSLLNRL